MRTTADGVCLVLHDRTLHRVAGLRRPVEEMTHHEVNQVRMVHGERIQTLRDVLEAFPGLQFNIDIKDEGSVASVPQVIREVSAWDRVRIASFSDRRRGQTLDVLAGLWAQAAGYDIGLDGQQPSAALSLLARVRTVSSSAGVLGIAAFWTVSLLPAAAVPSAWRAVSRLLGAALPGFDSLQVPPKHSVGPVRIPVATRRFIDAAHACGYRVDVWTVDDAPTMRRMTARGVDGIITNRADLATEMYPQRTR